MTRNFVTRHLMTRHLVTRHLVTGRRDGAAGGDAVWSGSEAQQREDAGAEDGGQQQAERERGGGAHDRTLARDPDSRPGQREGRRVTDTLAPP